MTVILELRPETEARLKENAASAGLSLEQYLTGWIEQTSPGDMNLSPDMISEEEMAKLVAQAEEPKGEPPAASLEDLFARWREEDNTDDEEELTRRDTALEQLKANLNANRAATGERQPFP